MHAWVDEMGIIHCYVTQWITTNNQATSSLNAA